VVKTGVILTRFDCMCVRKDVPICNPNWKTMKRDRPQRDRPAVYVAAFRHFRLIALFSLKKKRKKKKTGALFKNCFFFIFYFLKIPNSEML